jgi:hypothetical protein
MNLTPAQAITLKTFVEGNSAFNSIPRTGDGVFALRLLLENVAVPDFIVWKSIVTQDEIMMNGMDWTRIDNLSIGKARIWEWMFDNQNKSINPSKPNIQTGINTVWVGTQADLDVRAQVYIHCKRQATIIEKLFATGTGTTASPGNMVFDGDVSYSDLLNAMMWW